MPQAPTIAKTFKEAFRQHTVVACMLLERLFELFAIVGADGIADCPEGRGPKCGCEQSLSPCGLVNFNAPKVYHNDI